MGIAALIMMSSVFLSRLLGFARDAVIAYTQGANAGTDAYFAAFTIPDFLNYLLAGASLSITFIPIYTAYLKKGKVEEGNRAFSSIFCILSTLLVIFVILGEIFTEQLIPLIAPGFQASQVVYAAHLTRIVMPAQLFFYAGGLFMAVQYSRGKFLIPALAPLIYNGGIITGGLLLGKKLGMEGFAWGVLGGSFIGNFFLQGIGAYREGLRISLSFDTANKGLREFIRLSLPIMLGFSLVFVDEWMSRVFGSFLVAGAITWLNNARRLSQVPLGIFGQASGVASYPFLAKRAAEGDIATMFEEMGAALDWVFFLSTIAASFAFLFSKEIVLVVFMRGAFGMNDTVHTAFALSMFALGIPFWCAQNIVARGFFAMKDTLTPTIIGTLVWVVTLPAYYYLMVSYGVVGLASASTIGIVVHTLMLYGFLVRKTKISFQPRIVRVPLLTLFLGGVGTFILMKVLTFMTFLPTPESMSGAFVRMGAGFFFLCAFFFFSGLGLGLSPSRVIAGRFLHAGESDK